MADGFYDVGDGIGQLVGDFRGKSAGLFDTRSSTHDYPPSATVMVVHAVCGVATGALERVKRVRLSTEATHPSKVEPSRRTATGKTAYSAGTGCGGGDAPRVLGREEPFS